MKQINQYEEITSADNDDWILIQPKNGGLYKKIKRNNLLPLGNSGNTQQSAGILSKLSWYYPLSEQHPGYNAKNGGAMLNGNIRQSKGVNNRASLLCDGSSFLSFNSGYSADMQDYILSESNWEFFGWLNLLNLTTYRTIFSKDNGSSREYQLTFIANEGGIVNRLVFSIWTSGIQRQLVANSLGTPAIDTWYFFSIRYLSSPRTLTLEFNNNSALSNTLTLTGVIAGGASEFRIGALGAFGIFHVGKLFGLGFIKGNSLTPSERSFIYNNGLGRSLSEL